MLRFSELKPKNILTIFNNIILHRSEIELLVLHEVREYIPENGTGNGFDTSGQPPRYGYIRKQINNLKSLQA